MNPKLPKFLILLAISFGMVIVLGIIASIPGLSFIGMLLLPVMFLAPVLFPEGVHSDWPFIYLAVAVLIDCFICLWPALLISRIIVPKYRNSPPRI